MKNNIDNNDFNKWLKSTAEDQGISEQQLLSEIISAYSVMHEMKTSAVSASNHQINSASDIVELKNRLDDVERRIEDSDSENESDIIEMAQHVVSIEEYISEIEHELEKRITEIEDETSELNDMQDDLSSKVDDEFSAVENAFERFETRTDSIEERIEQLISAYNTEMEAKSTQMKQFQQHFRQNELLGEIKREAAQLETLKPDCEDCGSTVHLGLLTTPECPHCGAAFSANIKNKSPLEDIINTNWDPFSSAAIETKPMAVAKSTDTSSPDSNDEYDWSNKESSSSAWDTLNHDEEK